MLSFRRFIWIIICTLTMPPKSRTRADNAAATDSTTGATASTDFEAFVRSGITDIRNKLESLELSIEFQSQRTSDLEQRMTPLEIHVKELQKKVDAMESKIKNSEEAENKLERFSRKNNIRIVGIKKESGENTLAIAAKVFEDFFHIQPRVERAHRDGASNTGHPQHILVKLLSYQDKRDIMARRRDVLKDQSFFITDDLTKKDLEEKRKYAKEAADAYCRGERLHFSAGKWRNKTGLANFYTSHINSSTNSATS